MTPPQQEQVYADAEAPRPQVEESVEATPDEPARPSPFDLETIEETVVPKNRLAAGRAFKKWLLRGGLITLALLIAGGGLLFMQGYNKVHKVFRGEGKVSAFSASADQQLLKGEKTGHVNILLLGNGGIGHDGSDLTDTIIVESIDTVRKTASLISVPRDLWVQVPGHGSMKINAAYETGKYDYLGKIDASNANTEAVFAGFKTADQIIGGVLGITIDYNALVNFTSFREAVDSVGGVTVNVPEQLYDPTMAWENHNNPVLAQPGVQEMNGKQALLYVRSRETTSDFARSQRQRAVILALKDKVLSAGTLSNPLKISQLINAFGDNLVTDMSLSEAMRAYSLGKDMNNSKIASIDLVTPPHDLITTGGMNGLSIDKPRAGLYEYSAIQEYIQQVLNPPAPTTPSAAAGTSSVPENAAITVLNGTATEGLAGRKAATLKAAGYNVVSTGNAPATARTVVVDYSGGADPNTKSYLEKTFGTTAVTTSPYASVTQGSANFVVILGSDQS